MSGATGSARDAAISVPSAVEVAKAKAAAAAGRRNSHYGSTVHCRCTTLTAQTI